MRHIFSVLIFIGLATAVWAEPIKVASLSTVLSDIARNVGGNRVEVREIIKQGSDPHLYEPTPGDIKKISNVQIVLASGLGFEPYLDKLRSSVEKSGVQFVVAGSAVKPIACMEVDHHDHSHADNATDPHWWHSIANVEAVTLQVRDAFIAADPAGRTEFEANAKAFDDKLKSLSKWVRLELAGLPKSKRILVTSHDALGYFAKDYGFEILPVQGISTADQPSSQKVRHLIQEIKDRKVKAIFAENIENPKVLRQITIESGANLGGTLYADGLGSGDAGTYLGMMRCNVTTIVGALQ
jgi:zinc/manganese transport system substrate-binding protein